MLRLECSTAVLITGQCLLLRNLQYALSKISSHLNGKQQLLPGYKHGRKIIKSSIPEHPTSLVNKEDDVACHGEYPRPENAYPHSLLPGVVNRA